MRRVSHTRVDGIATDSKFRLEIEGSCCCPGPVDVRLEAEVAMSTDSRNTKRREVPAMQPMSGTVARRTERPDRPSGLSSATTIERRQCEVSAVPQDSRKN